MIHTHRVTYADCTLGNHVYYSRYLDLLEAARGAYFRELDFPFTELEAQDVALPVIRVELDYRSAAHYDEVLHVAVRLEELGRVKLAFGYDIRTEGGRLVAEGRTLHGITTRADKPRRLPTAVLEVLAGRVQGGEN